MDTKPPEEMTDDLSGVAREASLDLSDVRQPLSSGRFWTLSLG